MKETSQDERVLWLAVIRRAQEEADGRYTYWADSEKERVKRDARKWLTHLSRGLCEVCELAGFSRDMTERLVADMRSKYGR